MTNLSRLLDLPLLLLRAAVCLVLACWACGEAVNGTSCSNWPLAQGTVTASSLKKVERKWGESYDAEIRYEYQVNGKTYSGDRVQFGSSAFQDAAATVAKYPLNAKIEVRYEKANPAASALEPGFNQLPVLASLLGAILIICLGFKEFANGESRKPSLAVSTNSTANKASASSTANVGRAVPTITIAALVAIALVIPWAADHLVLKGINAEWLTFAILFGGGLSLVMFFAALPSVIAHFVHTRQFKIAGALADFNGFVFSTFFPVSVEAAFAAALQSDIAREQLAFAKANRLAEKAIAVGTEWLSLTTRFVQEDDNLDLKQIAMKSNLQFQEAHCREIVSLCHHDIGETAFLLGRNDEAMNRACIAADLAQAQMSTGTLRNGSSIKPGALALANALTLKGRVANRLDSHEEARKDLEKALALRNELQTQFSEKRAELLAHLAACYSLQGESKKAQDAIAAGLELVANANGPQFQLATATLLQSQGQLLMREGKLKEAEVNLKECLRLRTKLHPTNHPQIAETIMVLADLLTEQGQSVKALDLNNKAQKLLKDCQVYA